MGLWLLGAALLGCVAGKPLQKGEKHYELGEYEAAIAELKKAVSDDPARVNLLIAESYRRSNRIGQATPFYQKALEAGSTEPSLRLYYGYALKANGNYAGAAEQLDRFTKSRITNRTLLQQARRELDNLSLMDSLRQIHTPYKLQPLTANTATAEFAPLPLGDELIFTASRKKETYKANGQPMLGLYKAKLISPTETGTPELFSPTVNADNVNEGTPVFTKDGKTMIFARGNTGRTRGKGNTSADVDLYISRKGDAGWNEPERLAFSDSASWDGSPAFSADGRTLYFASNRAGGSGGLDLWRVNMDNAGRFGRPANMGRELNTPGNEMFPSVTPEGVLFFASDGHPGYGGLDVFEATRDEDDRIVVRNMGTPFNTPADDFGLVWADSTRGYLASNREGGKGDDDLYFVEKTDAPLLVQAPPRDTSARKQVRYFIAGTVRDSKNQQPLPGVRVQVLDDADRPIGEITTDADGRFGVYPIRMGRDYTIALERPEYLKKRELFSTAGRQIPPERLTKPLTDTTFYVDVAMLKPSVGDEISRTFNIETIYYDFDKWDIRTDAATELDKVVQILQDNPGIKLELGSHTDLRGNDAYNQRLSQRRAESAVAYILSKGISGDRITARGYGESQPVVPNAQTPEEHQLNRRTEFKVISLN